MSSRGEAAGLCEDLGKEKWPASRASDLASYSLRRGERMAVEPQQQAASAPNAAPAASTAPAGGGGGAPQRVVDSMSTRVDVINTHAGRILCVADVRGQSPSLSAPARPRSLILSRVDRVTRPTACRRRSDSTSATQRTAMHAYRGGGAYSQLELGSASTESGIGGPPPPHAVAPC